MAATLDSEALVDYRKTLMRIHGDPAPQESKEVGIPEYSGFDDRVRYPDQLTGDPFLEEMRVMNKFEPMPVFMPIARLDGDDD
jgi:hypothetical protein